MVLFHSLYSRISAAFFFCTIYLIISDMFDIITEPDWDIDWLDVQFDPDGNACAMQDRYALKAQERDDDWYSSLISCYEDARDEHGIYSVLTLSAWNELRSYERPSPWDYLDPVVLGPYTREALVGRDDYQEF